MQTKCKWQQRWLTLIFVCFSKERIEHRGAIAKDVNLDVQILRPPTRLNLLETILQGNKRQQSKYNLELLNALSSETRKPT